MPQTWNTSEAVPHTCPQCKSLYRKTVTRLPVRDRDTAECTVCAYELARWNSTEVPSYQLVEAKPWPVPAS